MIAQDDPRHRQQRMLVQPMLTGKSVGERQAEIAALATELLDAAFAAGDEMEVVGALSGQLPARLTARLLGFPESYWPELKSWSERLMRTDMRDRDGRIFTEFMAANMEFVGVLGEVAADKYANPTDDLISTWVHSTIDDQPLSPENIVHEVGLFIAGSSAMTASSLSCATLSDRRTRPRASITPSSSVRTSSISRRLAGSSQAALLATSRVVEVRMVSTILSPLRLRVDPVSVRSTRASIISGTLASVAP
jgi:hypothetical protein